MQDDSARALRDAGSRAGSHGRAWAVHCRSPRHAGLGPVGHGQDLHGARDDHDARCDNLARLHAVPASVVPKGKGGLGRAPERVEPAHFAALVDNCGEWNEKGGVWRVHPCPCTRSPETTGLGKGGRFPSVAPMSSRSCVQPMPRINRCFSRPTVASGAPAALNVRTRGGPGARFTNRDAFCGCEVHRWMLAVVQIFAGRRTSASLA